MQTHFLLYLIVYTCKVTGACCRLLVQKVAKVIKPYFKAESLTFAVQVCSLYQHMRTSYAEYFTIMPSNNKTIMIYTCSSNNMVLHEQEGPHSQIGGTCTISLQGGAVLCSAVQCSAVQCSAVQSRVEQLSDMMCHAGRACCWSIGSSRTCARPASQIWRLCQQRRSVRCNR